MSRRRAAVLVLAVVAVGAAAALPALDALRAADPVGGALPPPLFVDETATAGIDHAYDGEFMHIVGGGVAVLDCDDDGRQDLYLAGGSEPAALYRNRSQAGGALAFEPVPHAGTELTAVTGAYPLDIDGDGITDLSVLRVGENVLLRGTGDCAFERANERWGFEGGDRWTAAFSATWEGDGLPTLAFGNYLELGPDGRPPREPRCADNELWRAGPAGDRYEEPIALSPGWCTLSLLFSDWDRSGRRDLRVSNDRHYYRDGEEQLWRMDSGEPPRLWTHDEGWQRLRIFGMGIASRDLTDDGYPEVYLTSQGDNKLQTLADGPDAPRYEDIALGRGATAHRPYAGDTTLPSTAWHAEFADVNNDGLADLFVAKGNVEAQTDHAMRDPNNLLLGQADGTFVEAAEAAGVVDFTSARGAALADLNLDGLLDLVVVHRRANVGLWRNVGSGSADEPQPVGNWIALRLEQPGPNRDAIGAWLEIRAGGRTIRHEVTVGGGHAGGQSGPIHVGIGSASDAEVIVEWPDGERSGAMHVAANGFATITRGSDAAVPGDPG